MDKGQHHSSTTSQTQTHGIIATKKGQEKHRRKSHGCGARPLTYTPKWTEILSGTTPRANLGPQNQLPAPLGEPADTLTLSDYDHISSLNATMMSFDGRTDCQGPANALRDNSVLSRLSEFSPNIHFELSRAPSFPAKDAKPRERSRMGERQTRLVDPWPLGPGGSLVFSVARPVENKKMPLNVKQNPGPK
ncbi:hypothetical protein IFM46972_00231 [Aspergillus udagawae]|uniref:Uncharacterized protein n=1 Tax=Aspergillus udagawae TaxID=91492 RepID=A0A8H3RGE4_9EURO|nr:hypothetical protein IFM46972_00231 [Aspergillus udagawae]